MGCCGGKGVRRCLVLVGLLYFQVSTFALVQWLKEHADVHGGMPLPRMHHASEPDDASPLLALPPAPATTPPSPPPTPAAASASAGPSRGSEALPSSAEAPSRAEDEDEEAAVDERPNEPPRLLGDRDLRGERQRRITISDKENEPSFVVGEEHFGLEHLGEHGEEPAVGEELVEEHALALPEGEAGMSVGAELGPAAVSDSKVKGWLESDAYGKFIGISTFFNPGRHQNKVDNFRLFRASVKAQGLQMLCVELTFGEEAFQLRSDDCDILLQRRTAAGNTLWQKERLLNIAIENLPNTVEKVMWLDSDLIFLNDDWVPETAALLDRYPVVQPFGWMTYLPQAEGEEYAEARLPTLPLGQGVGGVYHAAGLAVSSFPDMCFRDSFLLGHPGFAWAARRDVIGRSGFYDRSIIGGGDRIMLNGFTGHGAGYFRKVPPAMADDVRAFGKRLLPLAGPANVSYTPGVVLHIWHGDRANRDYTHRYEILKGNDYDPVRDVRVNEQGVLEWANNKSKLHREVTAYFNNRKEGPKEARNKSRPDEDMWSMADKQRKGLTRAMKSFMGYHCSRADYRPVCKLIFKLWGDALRVAQLQLHHKRLRKVQEEEAREREAAVAAHKEKKKKKKKTHASIKL